MNNEIEVIVRGDLGKGTDERPDLGSNSEVNLYTLPGTCSCPRRRRKTEVRPDHISEN